MQMRRYYQRYFTCELPCQDIGWRPAKFGNRWRHMEWRSVSWPDRTIKQGKGEKYRPNPHLSMHAVRSISVALISRCCFLLEVDERRLWKSIPFMAEKKSPSADSAVVKSRQTKLPLVCRRIEKFITNIGRQGRKGLLLPLIYPKQQERQPTKKWL